MQSFKSLAQRVVKLLTVQDFGRNALSLATEPKFGDFLGKNEIFFYTIFARIGLF